ncbi:cAMP-binding domain of CRP or a regulatory subunit of cAMP-dependent protein kinases [Paenibacillus sp. UNCCL117]|uniref:Crp/Fnr family transcriptional regulator n=1 Tax=unclassified Paenibacillus TaxID=185978 RepID=UPI00088F1E43|nr:MULTISPECIES: Crp/Fnr family transcriptional regulator [unclassified Paenibacillus]SDC91669.1 cAMP-binding domain of CRP or a regulatory subunit of cAMP-dependent protein kinases [Paenibacillus sp. cl123]SFW29133.1 cAMP-binding domain of CRP or a regulatory subunit of cAMP-dependent protein kinases [Paenibacillus sp. UNCCL117]
MTPDWNALHAAINALTPIPDTEWEAFKQLAAPLNLARHEHFIRAGETGQHIALCLSGLLRLYYTTPDGDEFNKSFCVRHEFIASYSSLLTDAPSFFSIQALTDSELLLIRFRDFRALYDRHTCWERLGRLVAEQLFVKKEIRERELLLLPAEARYLLFLERYGRLAAHIPLYHVASYLGITPVALSRIRRKITRKGSPAS